MAYDANGKWTAENDSVESRVRGLSGQDNDLNKQVRTQAVQAANARGLSNSSIAVGAGEDAVLKNAVSIAAPDANIAAQKNLSAQGAGQTTVHQAQQIQGQKEIQAVDVAARERDAAAERAAAATRLTTQLTSAEKVAAADVTSREGMAAAERAMQTQIANMNVESANRQQASAAATAIQQTYASSFAAIANNPDLPGGVRAQYLEHISAVMRSNIAMVETLWNVPLPAWEPMPAPSAPANGTPTGGATTGGGAAGSTTTGGAATGQPESTEDQGESFPARQDPAPATPPAEPNVDDGTPNPQPSDNDRWWSEDPIGDQSERE